jgi:Na+-transporting methylmalonyl-CoA/oxaloacetate decarboxylase gamma subunit
MSIIEGLKVSFFGISVVFVVLIALSFLVRLQTYVIKLLNLDKIGAPEVKKEVAKIESETKEEEEDLVAASQGELKLLGLDEKTAAMVMAIVSDESKIPLSKLQFKMIKAVD